MNSIHLSGFNCGNEKTGDASIRYLHTWIQKNGARKTVGPGGKPLETNENVILSVESGAWRLLIGSQKVISIIGPGGILMLDHQPDSYRGPSSQYEVLSHSIYYELPMKRVHLAAANVELLKGIFEFMTRNTSNISNKWLNQCIGDSYTEVKSALEWMNALPDLIRAKYTAIAFITDTTGVSRSHALSIMKSLKQGGYIDMDSGHLIKIKKNSPADIKYLHESSEITSAF